jgi:hypothetical protein
MVPEGQLAYCGPHILQKSKFVGKMSELLTSSYYRSPFHFVLKPS